MKNWDLLISAANSVAAGTTGELPPLYADAGALPDDVLAELLQRCHKKWQSDPRKRAQALRERMLRSEYDRDIENYLDRLYSPDFAEKVKPHVTTVANVVEDITRQVVQLYRGQTLRRVDGATKEQQQAFDELVRETRIFATAQRIAETAWGVGPQHIIPEIRRGRLRFLQPSPSTTDEVLDALDPTGSPVAVAYPAGQNRVIVVDGVSYRVFVVKDQGYEEITEDRVDHGTQDCPASTLRFDEPVEPGDWHMRDRNSRLVQANLAIGHLLAKLSLVRKGQGGKLLTVIGNIDGIARGQKIGDPVAPIVARNDTENITGQSTNIEALEFDTDPVNFIKHIRLYTEWAAESTGVPVSVTANGDKFDIEFDYDRLAELRTELVWWAETWERDLWTFGIRLAKTQGHKLASDLPEPDLVEKGFYLQLPPMHRKFADPKSEREHWDWLMSGGMASVLDKGRRYMGNRSDAAIMRQVGINLKINGKYWDEVAKRQAPAMLGPNGEVQTLAQAQGATGPMVRDRQALESGDDSDKPEPTKAGS